MHIYRNNEIFNMCSCTQGIVENRNDAAARTIMRKKLRLDAPVAADADDDVFDQVTVVAPTHVPDDGMSVVCPTELPQMKVAASKDDDSSAPKGVMNDDDGSAPEDDDKTVPTSRADDDCTVFDENTKWFDADYRPA